MKTQIENFLKTIEVENLNILDFVNIDDIDYNNAYNSIYEMIDYNCGFDVEIIYYTNACDYLREHDPSLRDSIQIALDLGYHEYANINSEFLASLHASEKTKIDFEFYETEIDNFFTNLLIN